MIDRRLLLTALIITALMTSCASREDAARNTFAQAFTCPAERIAVTEVEGVRWSEVQRRAHPIPDPPADIRSDPERLALWNKSHDSFSAGFDRLHEGFRVSGCGHEVEYLCQCPFDAPAWKQFVCTCEAPSVPLLPRAGQGKAP